MLHNKIHSKAIQDNWSLDRILTEAALNKQTAEQVGAVTWKLDAEWTVKVKKINSNPWPGDNRTNICEQWGYDNSNASGPAMGAVCDHWRSRIIIQVCAKWGNSPKTEEKIIEDTTRNHREWHNFKMTGKMWSKVTTPRKRDSYGVNQSQSINNDEQDMYKNDVMTVQVMMKYS